MPKVKVAVVIPARYAATRLPGKPLVPIAGRPMIQWVVEGCRTSKRAERIVVATDDPRIEEACHAFGAEVRLTSADCATGSDRVAEVAAGLDCEIVVNVQGDEPLIRGDLIDAACGVLEADPDLAMATLAHPADDAALGDPNRVLVVCDRRGRALYFSRSVIPFPRNADARFRYLQHIGLYAYRRDYLLAYVKLPPSSLEERESLEQLRALENGDAIGVAVVEGWKSVPVDVQADIAAVEAVLRETPEKN